MNIAELPVWFALPVAIFAGLISFASPCVAPLVPGYLAFISGPDPALRMRRSYAFVAGFGVVFTLLGATAAAASQVVLDNRDLAQLVGGIIVMLLGLVMIRGSSIVPASFTGVTTRMREPASFGGAMLVGAAFSIAWSPCIGASLGAISGLASSSDSILLGATLLVAYSAGLAVPFLLIAAGVTRAERSVQWIRRHHRPIQICSGVLLMLMGVLMATGQMGTLTSKLASLAPPLL